MHTFDRFSTIFNKRNFVTFVMSCMLACTVRPFWKKSTLKGKHLFPWGANSFLLEKNLFRRETKPFWQSYLPWNSIDSPKNVLFCVLFQCPQEEQEGTILIITMQVDIFMGSIHLGTPPEIIIQLVSQSLVSDSSSTCFLMQHLLPEEMP